MTHYERISTIDATINVKFVLDMRIKMIQLVLRNHSVNEHSRSNGSNELLARASGLGLAYSLFQAERSRSWRQSCESNHSWADSVCAGAAEMYGHDASVRAYSWNASVAPPIVVLN